MTYDQVLTLHKDAKKHAPVTSASQCIFYAKLLPSLTDFIT